MKKKNNLEPELELIDLESVSEVETKHDKQKQEDSEEQEVGVQLLDEPEFNQNSGQDEHGLKQITSERAKVDSGEDDYSLDGSSELKTEPAIESEPKSNQANDDFTLESSGNKFKTLEELGNISQELPLPFEVVKYKQYPPFVLEVEDNLFFFSRDKVSLDFDLKTYPKHFFYLISLPTANAGLCTFEGLPKYAQVLVSKKLLTQGLFDENQELIIWNTRKVSANQGEALYQVLPKTMYLELQNKFFQTKEGFILFEGFNLLYGLALKQKKAKAYVLQIKNDVLLLAGCKQQIFLFNKFSLTETTEANIQDVCSSIQQELANNPLTSTIQEVEWIEGFTFTPCWPESLPDELTWSKWSVCEFELEGKKIYTSLPFLLNQVELKASLTPKSEIFAYKLQKIEKWILGAMGGLAAAVGMACYFFNQANLQLSKNIPILKHEVFRLQTKLQRLNKSLEGYNPKEFKQLKSFAQQLSIATNAPKLVTLLNVLTRLKPAEMEVRGLKIAYSPQEINFVEQGKIIGDLVSVQNIFNDYLQRLKQKGFMLNQKKFNLNLDNNEFTLNFSYKLDNYNASKTHTGFN